MNRQIRFLVDQKCAVSLTVGSLCGTVWIYIYIYILCVCVCVCVCVCLCVCVCVGGGGRVIVL